MLYRSRVYFCTNIFASTNARDWGDAGNQAYAGSMIAKTVFEEA